MDYRELIRITLGRSVILAAFILATTLANVRIRAKPSNVPGIRIPLSGDELGHVLRLLVGDRPQQDLRPVASDLLDAHDCRHVPDERDEFGSTHFWIKTSP